MIEWAVTPSASGLDDSVRTNWWPGRMFSTDVGTVASAWPETTPPCAASWMPLTTETGRLTSRRTRLSTSALTRKLPRCGVATKTTRVTKGSGSKRSEEHTSELQSHSDLVCRLLLENKKQRIDPRTPSANPVSDFVLASLERSGSE